MFRCEIDGCQARGEHRLLGRRLCMVHFLRVKVLAAVRRVTGHGLAA